MLTSVVAAWLFISSVPLASANTFWWSFQGENSTDSYDPVFAICADKNATSCAACNSTPDDDNVGAKLCESSEKLSNICYEPKREETCCKDKYGTSCYKDFYCAYTSENVAFCCAYGEDIEDCGTAFNQTLSESRNDEQAIATATSAFLPSMTATDQTRVARPERTNLPNMVPGTTKTYAKDPEVEKKMSAAVKIGIAIGVFVAAGILITLAVIAILHWRKKTKYNAIDHGQVVDAKQSGPYAEHIAPVSNAAGAFEPMRNEPVNSNRQSWMSSTPSQLSGHTTTDPFSDRAAYTDHPAHPQRPVELQYILPPQNHS